MFIFLDNLMEILLRSLDTINLKGSSDSNDSGVKRGESPSDTGNCDTDDPQYRNGEFVCGVQTKIFP